MPRRAGDDPELNARLYAQALERRTYTQLALEHGLTRSGVAGRVRRHRRALAGLKDERTMDAEVRRGPTRPPRAEPPRRVEWRMEGPGEPRRPRKDPWARSGGLTEAQRRALGL